MNNNVMSKESIQLLNASSDSDSDISDLQFSVATAPQPPVQVRRKVRTKRKPKRDAGPTSSSGLTQCAFVSILKTSSIAFAVGGTLILGWMVVMLHSEVQELSVKLANVPTNGDDETLLGLKRSMKELIQNQTYNSHVTQNYSKIVEDFQKQLLAITNDVGSIKESLKDAPQMLNIGKELQSLKTSLASFEARMSDFHHSLDELAKTSPSNVLDAVNSVNSTLHGRIDFAMEDLHHHHDLLNELKNVTDRLSTRDFSAFSKRLDSVQSALVRLESRQRNTTAVVDAIMEVIQKEHPNA